MSVDRLLEDLRDTTLAYAGCLSVLKAMMLAVLMSKTDTEVLDEIEGVIIRTRENIPDVWKELESLCEGHYQEYFNRKAIS